ncbi:MAG: hypothetical protein IIV09_03450, partial [Selenomonadaceae bacterium]|nr:hypothetical protein [Selenomonadaceae bacterium]
LKGTGSGRTCPSFYLNRYARSYQLYSAVRCHGNQSDFTKKLKRGAEWLMKPAAAGRCTK